jgi:shikimate kinase
MNKNIILIGFMGTGKSTVGEILADSLELEFVDSDEIIEKRAEYSIDKIFAQKGEEYFRDLETEVIADLSKREGLVVSTGGGVVLRSKNMEFLQRSGIVILLTATPEIILKRVEGTDRPLLDVADPLEKIKELLDQREYYYEVADHKVETSYLEVEEVVDKIKEIIVEDK